jgi:TfoX/Sxy family transcriptional regulator of competence genes
VIGVLLRITMAINPSISHCRQFCLFQNNACTLEAYKDRGMQPFKQFAKQTFKNYYEVPEEILGNDDELAGWVRNVRRNVS